MSRPDRTGFLRRVVADGEDVIHLRCARAREFFPVLAAIAFEREAVRAQCLERERMYRAFRRAAGAERFEVSAAELREQRLRHDAACGITSTEEEHVVASHRYLIQIERASARATRRPPRRRPARREIPGRPLAGFRRMCSSSNAPASQPDSQM